jgi:hypothetical protein
MALTRDFKELVQKRIARDPAFGDTLLRDGIDTLAGRRGRYQQGDLARRHQGDGRFKKLD